MVVPIFQNVNTQKRHTEIENVNLKRQSRNEPQRYTEEDRLQMANELLKDELRGQEAKVLFHKEAEKLARIVVVEYAEALTIVKERERQLRASIKSIIEEERMSPEQKIRNIFTILYKGNTNN